MGKTIKLMDGNKYMQRVLWHIYGGRHDPPCRLCTETDEAMGPPLLAPGNRLMEMLRHKDGTVPGSERGPET
jgi:hypothetical protein